MERSVNSSQEVELPLAIQHTREEPYADQNQEHLQQALVEKSGAVLKDEFPAEMPSINMFQDQYKDTDRGASPVANTPQLRGASRLSSVGVLREERPR
jgi:hypothetical protein